jgi:ATP-dependent Lon protease
MGIFRSDDDSAPDGGQPERKPTAVRVLPLLPLRDIVVFPHMVVPLFVGRAKSIRALEQAVAAGRELLLVAQRHANLDEPGPEDLFDVGTIGSIIQLLRLPDGTVKVLVEGKVRAKLRGVVQTEPYFGATLEPLREADPKTVEATALVRSVHATFENYVKLNKKVPPEMLTSVAQVSSVSRLADTLVAHLNLQMEERQRLLELADPVTRLEEVLALMQSEIEVLEVEKKIRTRVKKQMERSQKEYYLNEQMRAIQKELGERDEFKNEIQELEEQLKKKKIPKDALTRTRKEIRKLKMMSPMSAEATVVRNYIDWMLSLPWDEVKEEKKDIVEAERVLNEDHYGLEKPKERILEYLAVQALVERMKGPILCFVGPPGVGKTSLGRSIARALGRGFQRISLGGVHDEAEIRGHRRTYVGALPGRIVQGLRRAGTRNPVFMLDEVDKVGADFRGDPSSALLEVLDPEQNHAFSDHYLEVPVDLSHVLFIATANQMDPVPPPLRDRMEVIELPGYIEEEKVEIARRFLVPRQCEQNGIASLGVAIPDATLRALIASYTREAGVRNLEREVGAVCRKLARRMAEEGLAGPVTVRPEDLPELLGPVKFEPELAERTGLPGVAVGLAWTPAGGDILFVESTRMPGKGDLKLTGSLGDVMRESAEAARSWLRGRAAEYGLSDETFERSDIHLHVPAGAVPKDGPSAGIAMVTSLTSLLTGRPALPAVAMTGEITLRGKVLPVGGIKEKILAAKRAGIERVVVPERNRRDVEEVSAELLEGLALDYVGTIDEALQKTLAAAA